MQICRPELMLFFFFNIYFIIYLFWPPWVLVAACGIF